MGLTYIELEMYSSYSHSFPLFLKFFSQSQKQSKKWYFLLFVSLLSSNKYFLFKLLQSFQVL